ncbi:LamG domain-containing protein, partial [archaeon]|nr:LamG domain-containing protein [archaeon]
ALAEGSHEFSAYTSDLAGNVNSSSANFSVDVAPGINFTDESVLNGTLTGDTSVEINVSIVDSALEEVKYNWNGTNFTLFNDSLVLMMNFDNVSALGENSTHVVDVSNGGNNGSVVDAVWNATGRYGGGFEFDGSGDVVTIAYDNSLDFAKNSNKTTWSLWYKQNDGTSTRYFLSFRGLSNVLIYTDGSLINIANCDGGCTNELSDTIPSLNEWHNVVVVYDSYSTSYLYVDGQEVDSKIGAKNFTSSNAPIYIGSNAGSSSHFNGSIDEVRIYNHSLSASEISQLYMSNLQKYDQSQWYLYVNQSKNATDGLDDGDYTYYASAKDSVGNENITELRSLSVGNFTLEVANAISVNESDVSGGTVVRGENVTINATISNATEIDSVWVVVWSGVVGSSIVWQGFMSFIAGVWSVVVATDFTFPVGDEVNYTVFVNDSLGQENNLSGNFTIVGGGVVVSVSYPLNTSYGSVVDYLNYSVSGDASLDLCWWSNDSGGWNSSTVSAGVNWSGLVSIEGSNNWSVYCNDSGNALGSGIVYFEVDTVIPTLNITSPVNGSVYSDNTPLVNVSSSEVGEGFIVPDLDGSLVSWWRMDDVNGSGDGVVDYMGVNNGSAVDGASQVDNGKFGKGFEFDGDGDYVEVPYNQLINTSVDEITVSAWVKRDESLCSYTTSWRGIVARGITDGYGLYWKSENNCSNLEFVFDVVNDLNDRTTSNSFNAGAIDGEWHHLVGIYDGTYAKIYFDGDKKDEQFLGGSIEDVSNPLWIGYGESDRYFPGSIDEVMIFNRSLSAEEILSLYNATRLEFNTSALVDGSHEFSAYTSDLAGNVNSSLSSFEVDTSLPTLEIVSPINGSSYNNGSVLVNVSSSEVGSGFIVPDLDGSLVSWWRMDDVNSTEGLVDYKGVNNGSVEGGAVQVDGGKFGKGFEFDGDGDYVLVDTDDWSGSFTVGGWVKSDETSPDQYTSWFSSLNSDINDDSFQLGVDSGTPRNYRFHGGTSDLLVTFGEVDINWHYLVVSFNGSTIMTYYDGSFSNSGEWVGLGNFSDYVMGRNRKSAFEYFNGSLDELMIYNRSLSASEIMSLYNATRLEFNTSTLADGSHDFTAYTSDLAGNVNSSLSSFEVDTSLPTLNISSPVNGSIYSDNTPLVNVSSSEVGSGFIVPDLDGSLVSWWRMDDYNGSHVSDYVGVNNGSVSGGASQVDNGKFGKGFEFDGSSGYIDCGNLSSTEVAIWNNSFTLSMWFKASEIQLLNRLFSQKLGGWSAGIEAYLRDGIIFSLSLHDGTTAFNFDDDAPVSLNKWHFLVAIRNESGAFLYLDSELKGDSLLSSIGDIAVTDNFILGEYAGSQYFNGSIDEVMILNRSLSSEEIMSLYNATRLEFNTSELRDGSHNFTVYTSDLAGNVNSSSANFSVDSVYPTLEIVSPVNGSSYSDDTPLVNVSSSEVGSGFIVPDLDGSLVSWWRMDDVNSSGDGLVDYKGVNNGSVLGGVSQIDNGKFGKGFSFDGVDDYVDFGNEESMRFKGNITLSIWVKADYLDGRHLILQRGSNATGSFLYELRDDDNNIEFGLLLSETGYTYAEASNTLILDGAWHHIVGTYNGSLMSLYIDNSLVDTTEGNGAISSNNAEVILGGYCWDSNTAKWNGSIDEVMVFNRSLGAEEVRGLYNATRLEFNSLILVDGEHNFSFYSSDLAGNVNSSSANFSVDAVDSLPVVNLGSPANATSSDSVSEYSFNATISDDRNIDNVTLYIWFENGTLYNMTEWLGVVSTIEYAVNSSLSLDIYENYTWNYLACDNASTPNCAWNDVNWSVEYFEEVLAIDFTSDSVLNGTATTNGSVEINVSILEANLDEVKYSWNRTNFTMYNDSLVLMYNFDDYTRYNDTSSYIHNLSTLSATWISDGKYGGAYAFDGSSDRLGIPDTTNINGMNTYERAYELWFKANETSRRQILYKEGGSSHGISIYLDSDYLYWGYWSTTMTDGWLNISFTDTENWHHFFASFDANTGDQRMYLDGVLVDSESELNDVPTHNGNVYWGYSDATLDYHDGESDSANRFNGSLDEFRIWNMPFTEEEVQQFYMSNLYKSDSSQWYLYVNQSKNSSVGLDDGDYTYFASEKNDSGNEEITEVRVLTIGDVVAPNVTLIAPVDGVSYTSSSQVVDFEYNVNDLISAVDNCSLIVDGSVVEVNESVVENGVNNFSATYGVGSYVWSVNCSDAFGNEGNSSDRSFNIVAPSVDTSESDSSSGGGGGGGAPTKIVKKDLEVSPRNIEVYTVINTVKMREIEIYNPNAALSKSINLELEGLEGIILIEDADLNFVLSPLERKVVSFKIVAPESVGVELGKILVNGEAVLLNINVNSKELLFDAGIVITDEFRVIDVGEKLEAQVTLIPMGEDPRLDVTLNYEIKDYDGKTHLVESETFLIEGQKTFKRVFATQKLLKEDYVLSMELVYPNGVAVSSSHFMVGKSKSFIGIFNSFLILLGVSIITLIFGMIWIIKKYSKIRNKKIKKKIKI